MGRYTRCGRYAPGGNSLSVATFLVERFDLGGESWTVSADGLEYNTFNLRQGVQWHDSVDLTAADKPFTYNAGLKATNAINWRSNLIQNGTPIQFELVDNYTFKVILRQPDATVMVAENSIQLRNHAASW